MSDADKDPPDRPGTEPSGSHLDDDEVRALLRRAMRIDADKAPTPPVLPAVQRKIRQRSKGKFYADGWSTTGSPKTTYFITSAVMLLIVIALYFALVPGNWGTP